MIERSNQLNTIERNKFEQCEQIIERGLQTFYEVGQALIDIRESELYREQYPNFEVYCIDRWGMIEKRAQHFMDAAKVIDNLMSRTIVGTDVLLPANEAQARPLNQLLPQEQGRAWNIAVETAPDGKVTAKHVQRVVDEIRGGTATQLKRDYDRLQSDRHDQFNTLFNPSDAALWDATPSVKEILNKVIEYRVWLTTKFTVANQLGKLSPEARVFVARKLRELANDFSHKADELEYQNE